MGRGEEANQERRVAQHRCPLQDCDDWTTETENDSKKRKVSALSV